MKISYLMISGLCSLLLLPVSAQGNTIEGQAKSEFKGNGDKIPPVDPTKPGIADPIDPSQPPTDGPLSLNYASNINFSKQARSKKEQLLSAENDRIISLETGLSKEVPNFIQVTDLRGTGGGWTLSVKQMGPLVNEQGTVINGGEIGIFVDSIESQYGVPGVPTALKERRVLIDDGQTFQQLVTASKEEGMGTWNIYIGSKDDSTKNVSLTVPEKEPKEAGKYNTSLVWQLQDAL